MSTLTDRYVHAVQRWVPDRRKEEIGRDLRGSIDELVDGRCAAGESEDAAERAVLSDLGDPVVHAARYTDRPLHLIGPRYFPTYWRLLLTLLIWVPASVGLVVAGVTALGSSDAGEIIGQGVGAFFQVALHVAFWTTLGFAIVERLGEDSVIQEWTVDDLPEDPQGGRSIVDAVGSVLVLGILAVAVAVVSLRDVPVIDPGLWSLWIPIILAGFVVGMVAAIWRFRAGRWTWPIALAEMAGTVLVVAPIGWLAARGELLSREFIDAVGLGQDAIERIDLITVLILVAVLVMSVIDVGWRGWTARRQARVTE